MVFLQIDDVRPKTGRRQSDRIDFKKSNEGQKIGELRAASVVLSIRLPRRTADEISRFPMDTHLGRKEIPAFRQSRETKW